MVGVVRDSVFDNCSTVAFDGSATFECNIVRNCGEGIRNRQAVTGNLFENNKGPAITILSQLNAHNNTFINNGLHDVVQTTSALCDFSYNYWGTTDGDAVAARIIDLTSDATLGFVNANSLLAGPPALSCVRQLTPTGTQPPFSAAAVGASIWIPAGMTLANSTRSNKVWDAPHSPYYVGRTIAVLDGTTLTIEAGVTVVFEENVGLVVRGRLEVVGAASAGVTLTLYRNETHAGSSDAWWTGVSLPVAGASVLLRYANITRAQAAVSGNQVIELENSIVSQNVQGVSGYRVTMKNSFVTQNVQGVSGDQVMVEHSIVAGNLRGLSCSHCALVNTTFEFNRQYGAEVLTGYVNESIARNNSVGYSTKSTFSITRNTIEDNDIGVSAGSYVTFLTNSIVRRNRIGISGSALREMSGNQITDNREAGVSLSGSGIYFMNNTISGSPVCLSANGEARSRHSRQPPLAHLFGSPLA